MKAVTRFAWRIFHKSVWTAMERPIYTKHGLMIEDRTRWVSLISFIFGLRYWDQWPDSTDNTSIIHRTKYKKMRNTQITIVVSSSQYVSPLSSNSIRTPRRNETNLDSLKSETWSQCHILDKFTQQYVLHTNCLTY